MNGRVLGTCAGIALLAAAIECAGAAVVIHDNFDGTFKWVTGLDVPGDDVGEYPGTLLDITRPASEQSGERLPGTIGKWYRPNQSSSSAARRFLYGEDGVQTPLTDEPVVLWWNDQWIAPKVTREYFPGEVISSQADWKGSSTYFSHAPGSDTLSEGTPAISPLAYIALRVKIADRWHYGWILFAEYDIALQWAYETEPDTPIQVPIPAPGGAFVALLGGIFVIKRRRRR
ncbi:MAG: hypothetical protein IT435_09440 [Phycisphaerales bacterium]|nr:hypothetical protein [Phycisphaerales bacterium]